MRMLIKLVVGLGLIFAAVGLGLLMQRDSGYVLLSYGSWTLETSLWLAGGALLLLGILSVFIMRLGLNVWHLPQWFKSLLRRRRERKGNYLLEQGVIRLWMADWSTAENHLRSGAECSEVPLVNWILAAKAAHQQKAYPRRDEYLQRITELGREERLAGLLAQVQWQIAAEQWESADKTLCQLYEQAPKHKQVLYWQYQYYYRQRQWQQLAALLPDLMLEQAEYQRVVCETYQQLLQMATHTQQLIQQWESIPRSLQREITIMRVYAQKLVNFQAYEEAEAFIRKALAQQWDNKLVYYYGLTITKQVDKQITVAEQWLRQHPDDPELMFCLARLCLASQLWGKARNYLEFAIQSLRRPEVYAELIHLLDQLKEKSLAGHYMREMLTMITAQTS